MNRPHIVWFQRDLRIEDHPALQSAIERGEPVVPLYIHSCPVNDETAPGAASRWWLHHSLMRLSRELQSRGSRLILRTGEPLAILLELVDELDAVAVYWTRGYEPALRKRDEITKRELNSRGIEAESFGGNLLFEPWDIQTKEGRPYQVFTPFWKACLKASPPDEPLPAPEQIRPPDQWPNSLTVDDLKLLPTIRWDDGFHQFWETPQNSAADVLDRFLKSAAFEYDTQRDFPATRGTSRLSPYLHFGEISPRTVWHQTSKLIETMSGKSVASATETAGPDTFLKEVGWREFAHNLIYHFPSTVERPLRADFERFPWRADPSGLVAWQKGETGYPIVDAGMRELWATGWMHNRVRMIVGSFLVKDLMISWKYGAAWFYDTLVDADLANNTLGWQWIAGCGADAAPYFRILNPQLQSEKFDPQGSYLRRWIPELKDLPLPWLHAPWTAPAGILARANVVLGKDYPKPIIDHGVARERALDGLRQMKDAP
ncbi:MULTISPECIES: cryptochrome/photolyase family protein [unclassified Schlesneria]|uniref:cryptochrome/photolyase family protein n=1 Tax=unclassified Schlesneria TaxID=2762017 RepID=UPI002F1BB751